MAQPQNLPVSGPDDPYHPDSITTSTLVPPNQLHPPSPQDVNPRTPPPSYASLGPPPGPYPSSYPYHTTFPTTPSRGFGPTPLTVSPPNQTHTVVLSVPLLPYAYYEVPGTADARARWRFAESFLWAIGVWVLCGFVLVLEVVGEGGRW
ncbi:hypothetical protein M413DRAFT_316135 [Hebeloma cylindrosporum]|uniref:Uncharacterized protein n=1 Tax=Hebeloma cylindrosporum TaxID=76867 RepID=A0A0C2YZT5_HEBCY|nr:hypothetical protein M413DRAFT_316135 [Hebeloma cylindrosporum h7]